MFFATRRLCGHFLFMNNPYEQLFKRTTAGIKPGLEVIEALLQALENPHQKLAVIHVAGTNGKGSVCAMLESVLRASGFKTGLYTSPHLVNFSERFRVNGEEIPKIGPKCAKKILNFVAGNDEKKYFFHIFLPCKSSIYR